MVTTASLVAPGAHYYYVYILAEGLAQPMLSSGISGIQLGINYLDLGPGNGLDIYDWVLCASYEFAQVGWPDSGTGNTITWVLPRSCTQELAVAGYFYVGAYSPTPLSVVAHPATQKVKTADCFGVEHDVAAGALGWVSFGGASIGGDSDGFNPCAGVYPNPNTIITQGPAQGSYLNTTAVSFEWTGTDDVTPTGSLQYAYRLDGAAWSSFAATTSVAYSTLTAGSHLFEVKARDQSLNEDLSPASRQFTVDLIAPDTQITSGPVQGGWVGSSSVTIGWTGTDNLVFVGNLSFAFRLDGGAWGEIVQETSTILSGLAAGAHTFEVRAADRAGNVDASAASRNFTVDLTPPETSITLGPAEGSIGASTTVVFGWAGSDDRAPANQLQFAYRLDAGGFVSNGTGGVTLTGLSNGSHTFQVRAQDLAGNLDPSPAGRNFVVDTTPPALSIVSGPAPGAHINVQTTAFSWAATDLIFPADSLRYAYRLDGAAFPAYAPLTSATLAGLLEGTHTFDVRCRDGVGNVANLSRSFTVDLQSPNTTITGGPTDGGWVNVTTVTCVWAGTDNLSAPGNLVYSYQLDSQPASAFAGQTSAALTGLAQGGHVFRVQSRDEAGNADLSPDTRTFSVDLVAPDTQILSGPAPGATIDTNWVTVTWLGTDNLTPAGALNYSYRLDGGADSPFAVSTATSLSGLPDGSHLFTVRARDLALNMDTTPATRLFSVDVSAPTVSIDSAPTEGSFVAATDVDLGWSATDIVTPTDSLRFSFRLDQGSYTTWGLSRSVHYSGLTEGTHTFEVRSRDLVGHIGVAHRSWVVDITEPATTLTGGPEEGSSSTSSGVSFSWAGSDNLAPPAQLRYAYSLDAGPFSAFGPSTATNTTGLGETEHVFRVQARDAAGNVDSSPAAVHFSVGLLDLQPTVLSAPDSAEFDRPLRLTWSGRNNRKGTASGPWRDAIYLSADPVAGSDVLVQEFLHSSPVGGEHAYSIDTTLVVPTVTPGAYWLVLSLDSHGEMPEENGEGNNTMVLAHPVFFRYPRHPDLHVTAIGLPPAGLSGQGVELSWTVQNSGPTAAVGGWIDKVYLSSDPQIGADQLISSFTFPDDLAPGMTYTHIQPVTLPPDTAGTFWVVVQTNATDSVREYADNVNNASVSSASFPISRTPYPDLTLTAVNAPTTGLAGGFIQVSWIVRNDGNAATSSPVWYDRVYVSPQPTLGPWATMLKQFQNTTYLPPGGSYQANQEVQLPAAIAGAQYILVMADAGGNVDERNNEGNNIRASTTTMAVTFQSAFLRASEVSAPPTAWSGQFIQVGWVVQNIGSAPFTPDAWNDALVLSSDAILGAGDVTLGTFGHTRPLAPGARDTISVAVRLPNGISGRRFLYAVPNISHLGGISGVPGVDSLDVTLSPPPDLVVTAVSAAPLSPASGATITVQWTVTNEGPGVTVNSTWRDALYASTDAILDPAVDRLLGTFVVQPYLGPGQSYQETRAVELPGDLYGNLRLWVCTDTGEQVAEGPYEGNNCGVSAPLQVTLNPPDLLVSWLAVTGAPATGMALGVRWRVGNAGAGRTVPAEWVDRIYLSMDGAVSLADDVMLIGREHAGGLSPAASYEDSATVILPEGLAGSFQLLVRTDADSSVAEFGAEGNNTAATELVIAQSPPVDFQVLFVGAPDSAAQGSLVSVQWIVQNRGSVPTRGAAWEDVVYLSADSLLEPAIDSRLLKVTHTGADADNGYYENRQVAIPNGPAGPRFLIVTTDASNAIYEVPHENNNILGRPLYVTSTTPAGQRSNLALETLTLPGVAGGLVSGVIPVQWSARNTSPVATRTDESNWVDDFYLSASPNINGQSLALGAAAHVGVLAPGEAYTESRQLAIPRGISGSYFLIVHCDRSGRLLETNESDNTAALPVSITIAPVDLQLGLIDAPATATSGQECTVAWSIINGGTAASPAGPWYDNAYLSRDLILDASDYALGTQMHHGSLAPGQGYSTSVTGTIPLGLTGAYYCFVRTDGSDQVDEPAGEGNNRGYDPVPVQITIPAPADLIVNTILTPALATAGEVVPVTWEVRNAGISPAPDLWYDAVYLSTDTQWDLDDPLLEVFAHRGGLAPGLAYAMTYNMTPETISARLPGVVVGNYRVIVRTDARNNVHETNESNNEAASANAMAVGVPELLAGVPRGATIGTGEQAFFRIGLAGSPDFRITVQRSNPLDDLQLFVGYGRMPTRLAADLQFELGTGNDAIVPGGSGGDVYLLFYSRNTLGNASHSITATPIPFGLVACTPGIIGNKGRVTLTAEGGQFASGATLTLNGPSSHVADSVVVLSSTRLKAIFHLHDIPVGPYDLVLQVPGRGSSVLSHGVSVQPALPLLAGLSRFGQSTYRYGQTAVEIWTVRNVSNVDIPYVQVAYQFEGANVRVT